jgi:hypothetical protein
MRGRPLSGHRWESWGNEAAYTNITTTSRYLRSTTLRLEHALTLLEQHQHQLANTLAAEQDDEDPKSIATSLPHEACNAPEADDPIDAEIVDVIEDVMVSLKPASWNQMTGWLAAVERLRGAA